MTWGPTDLMDDSWRELAACVDQTDVDFFCAPDDLVEITRARAVCASCRVRETCLAFAVVTAQPHGVWGAMVPAERADLRRRWLEELEEAS